MKILVSVSLVGFGRFRPVQKWIRNGPGRNIMHVHIRFEGYHNLWDFWEMRFFFKKKFNVLHFNIAKFQPLKLLKLHKAGSQITHNRTKWSEITCLNFFLFLAFFCIFFSYIFNWNLETQSGITKLPKLLKPKLYQGGLKPSCKTFYDILLFWQFDKSCMPG